MKTKKTLAVFLLTIGLSFVIGSAASFPARTSYSHEVVFKGEIKVLGRFDVRAFGAKGDGKTLDTPAVNSAIDAAAAAGGGTVRFPAGTYRCFSIHLKSNVALYLDQGATILAADPAEKDGQYDPPEPNQWDQYQDFGHSHWHNSLIWGENLENISILGPGRIDGKGLTTGGNPRRRNATTQQREAPAAAAAAAAAATPRPQPAKFGYPRRDTLPPRLRQNASAL